MFFDAWSPVVRVLVLGISAYILLVLLLRISGKRTLAKLNAFDLVVTVAMGSALATIILSKDTPLAEGVAAFLVLVVAQYLIAALSARFRVVETIAKADARCLLIDGEMREQAMKDERGTRAEMLSAICGAGHGDIADIAAVVLETDGSLSVIPQSRAGTRTALPTGG